MDRIWSTGRVRKDVTVLVSPPKVVEAAWQREAVQCGLPLHTLSHGLLSRRGSDKSDDAISIIRRAQSLAVDEAHNFLNQKSSRTRGLLGNMADVVIMFTATPINKGARDLLRIVDILGADNLDDSALKLFERLEKRMRSESNQFVTTPEERRILQKEVQRFTLRRTKSTLNRMVDEDPDSYCDDRGIQCRYPVHNSKTYNTGETDRDQKIVKQIREVAGQLKGLLNLQSGIEIPSGWKGQIDEDRYIQGRIQGAKGLAIYHVMSRLRSSRAALVEHLLGTEEACKQFSILERIKTEESGNVLETLLNNGGKVRDSSLSHKLPLWLKQSNSHKQAIDEEISIYRKILGLVNELSDMREQNKAQKLVELITNHSLVLTFDSCLISLEVFKKGIEEFDKNIHAIVATGTQAKSKNEINRLFELGSDAQGVIGLCSDAMSEGLNLQQASAVVLLDMPSVIRIAEQRVGRVDRMNSPHKEIEVWWPNDTEAYSLKTDRKFVRRYMEVKDILGSNLDLPENLIPEELNDLGPSTAEEMVEKLEELSNAGESWDGIQDAFQPIKELVDHESGIVPVEIYNQVRNSKARVISSVSLIKSDKPWAFFAIGGIDRGAPKWVYLESLKAKPITHLADVAHRLREHLKGDVINREMDSQASFLIEKFLNQILVTEKELLPRKKQRALQEMENVLKLYEKKAKEQEDWERKRLVENILELLAVPESDQGRPDLDKVAEAWLDVTRDIWYERLLNRRRKSKVLRLKDIRKDLQQKPLDSITLHQAFSSIQVTQSIHTRVVSAIVGVPD